MADREIIKVRNTNQKVKNTLMLALGEKAIQSENREYYEQAIRFLHKLEPSLVVAAVLGSRYVKEDVAAIMGIKVSTLAQYKAETMRLVRSEIDSDIYIVHASSIIPYFIGLVDVDLFSNVLGEM